jgi:magnesium chelatase family protein
MAGDATGAPVAGRARIVPARPTRSERRASRHRGRPTVAAVLARITTFAIDGLESRRVAVEVDVRAGGLPAFRIVGLADTAVREARERVRAAILNSGFDFPKGRITANLAPAYLRKIGPGFDLALALGVLAAGGQVSDERLQSWAVHGELSLGGEIRPGRGTLAVAEGARRVGLDGLIVPWESSAEAALVDGLTVIPAAGLRDAVELLGGERAIEPPEPGVREPEPDEDADLGDVAGQVEAVYAMEIAAAGGHNLLLEGPPGIGKTMLARRLPGILPPLTREEALEVTRIYSVAGRHDGGGLITRRPFRAPHHTISASGLVGGGPRPVPGEASLAHNGVLFLDELSEFQRPALEALRQPLEDGRATIVRGQRSRTFPTRFMLVAATNPCPCGYAGDPRRCRCTESDVARHRRRLSGPLLDRVDLLCALERPPAPHLGAPSGADSAGVRERVMRARAVQAARFAGAGVACNGRMEPASLRVHARLADGAEQRLREAYERQALSARGMHRVVRVARTIADLAGREAVSSEDVLTALGLRQDRAAPALAA